MRIVSHSFYYDSFHYNLGKHVQLKFHFPSHVFEMLQNTDKNFKYCNECKRNV